MANVPFLKSILAHTKGLKPREIAPHDLVWWGFIALIILFIFTALWSGYFFYSRVVLKQETENPVSHQKEITEKDIDEIIQTLDERQQKFDEILGQ